MENGAIFDRQISASSQVDANHAAIHGRLNIKATANNGGSWSAVSNDINQWLQIDLGSSYTKVTCEATQGRSDVAQWVTRYRLQYSKDGENFQYYREPGKTADKVKMNSRNLSLGPQYCLLFRFDCLNTAKRNSSNK